MHSQITQVFLMVIKAFFKTSAWLTAINTIILQWEISICAPTAPFENMRFSAFRDKTHSTSLNHSSSFKSTGFEFDGGTCFSNHMTVFTHQKNWPKKFKLVYCYKCHCDKNLTHCRDMKTNNQIGRKVSWFLCDILLLRQKGTAYHTTAY